MIIRARIATARLKSLAAAVGIFALIACRLSSDAPRALRLGIVSGDAQTTAAGTVLPAPLSVSVIDLFGSVTEGVAVTWAIPSGGGSLSATSTTTDVDGATSVTYTAGPTPGPATITATVVGIGTVTFSETIT
jgi:hypothetical protein